MSRIFSLVFWVFLTISCGQKQGAGKISLYKHGIPIQLSVPENVTINKTSTGDIQGLILVNDDGFNLQILQTPTSFTDQKQAKFYQRELIVNNPDFIKIVEDYDDGFLFELKDGDDRYYDFRFLKIMGTKEIIFQAGPTCRCSESQVRNMIMAVLDSK